MTAAYAAFANQRRRAEADPDSPRRRSRRARAVRRRGVVDRARSATTTAFLMSSMLADVINAGTGARARSARLHAAGRRQDRHDQRLQRRLVRRLHAVAGRRRLGRLRSAAHDPAQRLRRRRRRADVGGVHEGRHARRQAGVASRRRRASRPPASAGCRASSPPRAASTSRSSTKRAGTRVGRWSTPSTSRAAPSRPTSATCTRAAGSSERSRPSSAATTSAATAPRVDDAGLPPASGPATASTSGNVAAVDPATATAAEPPKKKRGFWSTRLRRRQRRRQTRREERQEREERQKQGRQGQDRRTAGRQRTVIRSVSKRLYAVSRRHRSSAAGRSAGAVDPSRHAAAEPDPRRPGRRRKASGCARHRASAELPESRTADPESPQTESREIDACGVCPACTRIARGVHPDVLVVEPGDTGSIKIDQVRDVIDRAGYRPFEGRRRVVIIDEADALVPQAQNALLKTLEEPPSASVFLLVTARPDVAAADGPCRGVRGCASGRSTPTTWRAVLIKQRAQRGGGARDRRDGRRQRRPRARRRAARISSRRATSPRVCSRRRRPATTRAGGCDGAKDAAAEDQRAAAQPIASSWPSHLRAMASLLRDVELLATGADRRALANPDVRAGARAAVGVPGRARRPRVRGRRSGARGAGAQCRRQDRRRLAGAAAMS